MPPFHPYTFQAFVTLEVQSDYFKHLGYGYITIEVIGDGVEYLIDLHDVVLILIVDPGVENTAHMGCCPC